MKERLNGPEDEDYKIVMKNLKMESGAKSLGKSIFEPKVEKKLKQTEGEDHGKVCRIRHLDKGLPLTPSESTQTKLEEPCIPMIKQAQTEKTCFFSSSQNCCNPHPPVFPEEGLRNDFETSFGPLCQPLYKNYPVLAGPMISNNIFQNFHFWTLPLREIPPPALFNFALPSLGSLGIGTFNRNF